jgi:hypothetical protein
MFLFYILFTFKLFLCLYYPIWIDLLANYSKFVIAREWYHLNFIHIVTYLIESLTDLFLTVYFISIKFSVAVIAFLDQLHKRLIEI